MINALGGFSQVGMVVADIDQTMRYMTAKLGIGPFFVVRKVTPEDYYYRGAPAPAPLISLAFAQAGAMQVELIQQHNDAPSAYTEFLRAGREGCQHLSVWFSDRDTYTQARERLFASGLTAVHENGARAMARYVYFATDIPGGLMIEIAESLTPNVRALFDGVAQAAQGWTGADPIREVAV